MKKKLLLLLILVVIFLTYIIFKYLVTKNQAHYGRIKILSSPAATVFINSLAVGKTPFEEKLKEGEYLIKLIPEGTATESASWQGKIKIYRNSLTYVDRQLGTSDLTSSGAVFMIRKMDQRPKKSNLGEIEVETEPAGAIVYLDNDEKGVAPLILADVPMGDHELSVFYPGFFRRSQKINVDPGFRVIAQFKLAMDPSQKKIEIPEKKETTTEAKTKKIFVVIKDTPTGWLRVRDGPSITASETAKVKPNEKFELLEEKDGWYKINYAPQKEGWVYSQYATKQEE